MVLAALVERDYRVLIPFGEGHSFDLAVYFDDARWVRIQCKTARPQRGCLVFNPHTTDHGRGRLSYAGLADVFGVYFPPNRAVYLVPVDAVTNYSGRLRLDPPRNNQRRGIRFAADFEIDRWSPESLSTLVQSETVVEEPLATVA